MFRKKNEKDRQQKAGSNEEREGMSQKRSGNDADNINRNRRSLKEPLDEAGEGREAVSGGRKGTEEGAGRNPRRRETGPRQPVKIRQIELDEKQVFYTDRRHNTELVIITYVFVAMFLLLAGYLVYLNVFEADALRGNINNTKKDSNTGSIIRGDIMTEDGVILATTYIGEGGEETRAYPYENVYAHVIGYASNGKSGLEAEENYDLLTSHSSLLSQMQAEENGEKIQGDRVVVTLDDKLQQTAYYALGAYRGAVVVLEPDTGKILAMVSKPDFNPGTISQEWESMVADDSSSALLNRATQGLYPPGSTFKMLTSLAYLREHPSDYSAFSWDCQGALPGNAISISCYNSEWHGMEDLRTAFANSCNTAFAKIGTELGPQAMIDVAESFLFNHSLPTALSHSQSSFALKKDSGTDELMTTAIGQGDTLVTPLHMALITATIANGGVMMRPYYVDRIETYDGDLVSKNDPSVYKKIMSPDEAGVLTRFMEAAVTQGTAYALAGSGYSCAGKTGSAEYESNGATGTHSWFCGFADTEEPDIVVVVIAEDGGTGSSTAVPIAKQIFDAYYYG